MLLLILKSRAKWLDLLFVVLIIFCAQKGFSASWDTPAQVGAVKQYYFANAEILPKFLGLDAPKYRAVTHAGDVYRTGTLFHIYRVHLASMTLDRKLEVREEIVQLARERGYSVDNMSEVYSKFEQAVEALALHHDRAKVDPYLGSFIADRLATFEGISEDNMTKTQKLEFNRLRHEFNALDRQEEQSVLKRFGMGPGKGFWSSLGLLALDVVDVVDKSDTFVYRGGELGKKAEPTSQYSNVPRVRRLAKIWEPWHWLVTNHLSLSKADIKTISSRTLTPFARCARSVSTRH